jgi:hypothetical protein
VPGRACHPVSVTQLSHEFIKGLCKYSRNCFQVRLFFFPAIRHLDKMRYLTQTLSKMFHLQSSFFKTQTNSQLADIFTERLQPTAGFLRPIYSANLTSSRARAPVLSAHIHNNLLSKSTQTSNLAIRSPDRGFYTDSGQPLFEASIFPPGWDGGRHPNDLEIFSEPIKPEFIYATSEDQDGSALWYRTSFKTSKGFVPSSFLIDTGAPSGLYVTEP